MVYRLILLVFLFVFAALPSHAGADTRPIKAVTFEFPPYEYTDGDGNAAGLAVETVKEICQRLKLDIEIEVLPWARALKDVEMGASDLIFTAYFTEERAEFLRYVNEVIMPQEVAVFVYKNSSLRSFHDVLQTGDLKIGVRRKISYGPMMDRLIHSGGFSDIWEASDDINLLRLLAHQRVDLVPLNRLVARTLMHSNGLDYQIRELKPLVQSVPSYIAFSKHSEMVYLARQFEKEIRRIKADGTYQRIFRKWSS
ncbi:transporter substrate-binding domain-containing protein [Terasakiella sp. A23]|uniref:substrate-binding periplasmic protein n=1 Tax=Terasakiella sp. FCG-A23 TaxID=3080561 RepID=UPI002955A0D2|nr:transporter substrate-binding domain-containing protein [Terasakiella sp. A23]MDV7339176.1 transporter substrate-binding domain-containing protein [Terasakiella sp. A23]